MSSLVVRVEADRLNISMRYRDIMEATPDPQAHADAQRAQRDKLARASEKIATASQTYQATVKAAHTSAAAAKRKLTAPQKHVVKPVTAISPIKAPPLMTSSIP